MKIGRFKMEILIFLDAKEEKDMIFSGPFLAPFLIFPLVTLTFSLIKIKSWF